MAITLTKKNTTSNMLELSISYMVKKGCILKKQTYSGKFTWKQVFLGTGEQITVSVIYYISNILEVCPYVELIYEYKEEPLKYKVFIDYTHPHFGGERLWFLCPNCHRRVSFLYAGKYFLCRKCQNLCYQSQQSDKFHQMLSMARKCENLVQNKDGSKKKWLHWNTYDRLMNKAKNYETRALLCRGKLFHRLGII